MKISEFTEILKAGKDSIIPIVTGKINRKITIDNLKKSMELSSDDISYSNQNNLDGGNTVQDAIASIANAVNQLARDGVALADIQAEITNYFNEHPIASYSYTLVRDGSTGAYNLNDINGNSCGNLSPVHTISDDSESIEIPTSGAVKTLVDSATTLDKKNNVVVTDANFKPVTSGISTTVLNKIVTDTGWKAVTTLSKKFELYYNGSTVQYRKVGQTVFIRGVVSPLKNLTAAAVNENAEVIFTLPSGFIPTRNCQFVCQGSGANRWLLSVYNTGEVTFSRYGASSFIDCPIGAYLPFNVSFLIN